MVTADGNGYDVFTVGVLDLGSDRNVNAVTFGAGYTITGGTLTIDTGSIVVDTGVVATIQGELLATNGITKSGAGTLVVSGSAPDVVIASGTLLLDETGIAGSLTIDAGASGILRGTVTGHLVNHGLLEW